MPAVLEAGKPSGMYDAESSQEDVLVLSGTWLLLIEEEECHSRRSTSFLPTGYEPPSSAPATSCA
jgi:hypothetical protein